MWADSLRMVVGWVVPTGIKAGMVAIREAAKVATGIKAGIVAIWEDDAQVAIGNAA